MYLLDNIFNTKLWFFLKCRAHKKVTVKVQLGWTHIGSETTSPHLSTRKKHDETVTSTNTATRNSCRSLILGHEGFLKRYNRHSSKKKNADSFVQIRNLSHTREKRFLKESNSEGKQNFTQREMGLLSNRFIFFEISFFFFFSDYNFQFYAYMKNRFVYREIVGKTKFGFYLIL